MFQRNPRIDTLDKIRTFLKEQDKPIPITRIAGILGHDYYSVLACVKWLKKEGKVVENTRQGVRYVEFINHEE